MCELDVPSAHRRFAAEAFNGAWDLIVKEDRSDDETAGMIHMAHASVWHWDESGQADAQRFSVGAWQLARVYAVAGEPARAHHYAEETLRLAETHRLEPFFIAYGHEALARAAAVGGDFARRDLELEAARTLAHQVEDDADRRALLNDLDTI